MTASTWTPRVKICGLRRPADAELCLDLGADYLGCVLAQGSPRRATEAEVRAIASVAGDRAKVVLVFRGASESEVLRCCDATGVRRVQIHGTDPRACRLLAFYGLAVHPVYPVVNGASRLPVLDALPRFHCPAILDGGRGGSGTRFDWKLLSESCPDATLIAGGITADNVDALLGCRPFGIDLSSGVESAPGRKDPAALRRLFAAVEQSRAEVAS